MPQTHRIGDLTIRLRPWPTPDPDKCDHKYEWVGVLYKSGLQAPVLSPMTEHRWSLHGLESTQPEIDWSHLIDNRGWFWLTEPPALTWVEGEKVLMKGAVPVKTWTSGRFEIVREFDVPMHGEEADYYTLRRGVWHKCFHFLEEAQREAADHARAERTRRDP